MTCQQGRGIIIIENNCPKVAVGKKPRVRRLPVIIFYLVAFIRDHEKH
jgi:hypothetical protein